MKTNKQANCKPAFWSYNPKSIFRNTFIRGGNYVLIFLSLSAFINVDYVDYGYLLILALISGVSLNYYLIKKRLNATEFFEWDVRERKKKASFIASINVVQMLFCLVIFIAISSGVIDFLKGSIYGIYFRVFALAVYLFNAFFCLELHYPIFFDDLLLQNELQDKPSNWVDGMPILTEDEELEMHHRAFLREFNL